MVREIERTTRFKKDYKREMKGQYRSSLERELNLVLEKLLGNIPLPDKFRDHQLGGEWMGARDCHIKPDLVLIYEITDDKLILRRLGSHSELSL